jgi:hypothetical protein
VKAALFEAECEPGAAQSVATEFATRPHVFSVNITTGQHNLYALVVAADQALLSELVADALPAIPRILRVQSALITHLFSGTRWRLGGLSSGQVRAVTANCSWLFNTTADWAFGPWPRRLAGRNPWCAAAWVC